MLKFHTTFFQILFFPHLEISKCSENKHFENKSEARWTSRSRYQVRLPKVALTDSISHCMVIFSDGGNFSTHASRSDQVFKKGNDCSSSARMQWQDAACMLWFGYRSICFDGYKRAGFEKVGAGSGFSVVFRMWLFGILVELFCTLCLLLGLAHVPM